MKRYYTLILFSMIFLNVISQENKVYWNRLSFIREKYHKGYWLQYYLYKDLEYLFLRKEDKKMLKQLNKTYFSENWKLIK